MAVRKWLFAIVLLLAGSTSALGQLKVLLFAGEGLNSLSFQDGAKAARLVKDLRPTGGGYLLDVEDLGAAKISAMGKASFRLHKLDDGQQTNWVHLNAGQSVNLDRCLHGYPAEGQPNWLLGVAQAVGASFSSIRESSADFSASPEGFEFARDNPRAFRTPQEFALRWKSPGKVDLLLFEEGQNEAFWHAPAVGREALDYEALPPQAREQLQPGRSYLLRARLGGQEFDTPFRLGDFVFLTEDPSYFLTQDSILFRWESPSAPHSIRVEQVSDNQVVWQSFTWDKTRLAYADIKPQLLQPIVDRKSYRLVVETRTAEGLERSYPLLFEVLLDEQEFLELKDFVGW